MRSMYPLARLPTLHSTDNRRTVVLDWILKATNGRLRQGQTFFLSAPPAASTPPSVSSEARFDQALALDLG